MIRKGLSGGSFKPLADDAISKIHQAAMNIIEEVGFEVNSKTALDLFEKAGAKVDRGMRRVRMPEKKVMEVISTAPSEITLCGQDEKNDMDLGKQRVYAGTGGTALYVYHPDTGKKQSTTLEDLKRIAKLVDHLDNIHFFLLPTYPTELPLEQVDVNRFFSGLDNTTKHIMGGIYTAEGVNQVIKMAEMIAGSPAKLKERPIISMI